MKNANKYLLFSLIFLSLFLAWTLLLIFIDVRSAGAMNMKIGLSSINLPIRDALGFNEILYVITDYLGLIPIIFVSFFAVFGLYQAVKRKSIMRVDKSILLLGAFYIIVFGMFALFEIFVVNYRPVLINSTLEASYPSSTTLIVGTVIPTCAIQIKLRIKSRKIKNSLIAILSVFAILMIVVRLFSGVHWISDIIGGILLSFGLVFSYYFAINKIPENH